METTREDAMLELDTRNLDELQDGFDLEYTSLSHLPTEVVVEIFTFLPVLPYWFSLRCLSKHFNDTLNLDNCGYRIAHLNLAGLEEFRNGFTHERWQKVVLKCAPHLKSLVWPTCSQNSVSASFLTFQTILGACTQLEKLYFVDTHNAFSSLYTGLTSLYSLGRDKDQPVFSQSVKCIETFGTKDSRSRRYGNGFSYASVLALVGLFPKLEEIKFSATSYKPSVLRTLSDLIDPSKSAVHRTQVSQYFKDRTPLKITANGELQKISVGTIKYMISQGLSPNTRLEPAKSLLDLACGSLSKEIATYLLKHGARPQLLSPEIWMKLMTQKTKVGMLKMLIEHTQNAKQLQIIPDVTFLRLMESLEDRKITSNHIQQFCSSLTRIQDAGLDITSSVYINAALTNTTVFDHLMNMGAKLDEDQNVQTAALASVSMGLNCKIIEVIMKHGGLETINRKFSGLTVLFKALLSNAWPSSFVCNFIMMYKDRLDITVTDDQKNTYLHACVTAKNVEAALIILEHYPKETVQQLILQQNDQGNTVLHLACDLESLFFAEYLLTKYGLGDDIVQKLLQTKNTLDEVPGQKATRLSKQTSMYLPTLLKFKEEPKPKKNLPLKRKKKQVVVSSEDDDDADFKPQTTTKVIRRKRKRDIADSVIVISDEEERPRTRKRRKI